MDDTDRKLLNEIQYDFPFTQRPYGELGIRLNCTEKGILTRIKRLKKEGIIRRIGGNFDSQQLGFASTLCAAHVPDGALEEFVRVVNEYPGVTHNYLRDHYYNIWFTFIASHMKVIDKYIEEIIKQTGVEKILTLPAVKRFKIYVNFELT